MTLLSNPEVIIEQLSALREKRLASYTDKATRFNEFAEKQNYSPHEMYEVPTVDQSKVEGDEIEDILKQYE